MRKLTWFVTGAAAGAAGAGYAKRKVRRTAAQLAPVSVARDAAGRARRRVADVGDAVREGRSAMRAREAELRARLDGRAESLDGTVGPDDTLLVDGRPVEPGQVIVLRDAGGRRRRRRSS